MTRTFSAIALAAATSLVISCGGMGPDGASGDAPGSAELDTGSNQTGSNSSNSQALTAAQDLVVDYSEHEDAIVRVATLALRRVDRSLAFVGAPSATGVLELNLPAQVGMLPCISESPTNITFSQCTFRQISVDGYVDRDGDTYSIELTVTQSRPSGDTTTWVSSELTATDTLVDGYACFSRTTPWRTIEGSTMLDNIVRDEDKCPVDGTISASGSVTRGDNDPVEHHLSVTFGPTCGEGTVSEIAPLGNMCAGEPEEEPML